MKKILLIILTSCVCSFSTSHASQEDCSEGQWVLIEDIMDKWAVPPDFLYPTYGYGPFGFWEPPTSCTDIVYEGSYKIESTKRLVCVNQPFLVKIQEAPTGGSCEIMGRAIPDPYFNNPTMSPCAVIEHLPPHPGSNYGQVTTANRMRKYQCDLCPKDSSKIEPGQCGCGIPDIDSNNNGVADCKEPNNLGPPCPSGQCCH